MRAEQPATQCDAVLVRKGVCDDTRIPSSQGEGRNRHSIFVVVPEAQNGRAGDRREPAPELLGEQLLLALEALTAEILEGIARRGKRDRAEHVRSAGLEPLRELGPGHVAERHDTDHAAALEKRRAFAE